ncbi:hypothetical protein T484DRAFT_1814943, partial [Baffinella frigidus]
MGEVDGAASVECDEDSAEGSGGEEGGAGAPAGEEESVEEEEGAACRVSLDGSPAEKDGGRAGSLGADEVSSDDAREDAPTTRMPGNVVVGESGEASGARAGAPPGSARGAGGEARESNAPRGRADLAQAAPGTTMDAGAAAGGEGQADRAAMMRARAQAIAMAAGLSVAPRVDVPRGMEVADAGGVVERAAGGKRGEQQVGRDVVARDSGGAASRTTGKEKGGAHGRVEERGGADHRPEKLGGADRRAEAHGGALASGDDQGLGARQALRDTEGTASMRATRSGGVKGVREEVGGSREKVGGPREKVVVLGLREEEETGDGALGGDGGRDRHSDESEEERHGGGAEAVGGDGGRERETGRREAAGVRAGDGGEGEVLSRGGMEASPAGEREEARGVDVRTVESGVEGKGGGYEKGTGGAAQERAAVAPGVEQEEEGGVEGRWENKLDDETKRQLQELQEMAFDETDSDSDTPADDAPTGAPGGGAANLPTLPEADEVEGAISAEFRRQTLDQGERGAR